MHQQVAPAWLARVGQGRLFLSFIATLSQCFLLFASLVDEFVAYILLAGKDEDVVADAAAAEL